jgi:glycerophosphoryl diester phosphodiesterase
MTSNPNKGVKAIMNTLNKEPLAEAGNNPSSHPIYPTMITAHAGAEDTTANTLESLRTLLTIGADAVEVDVRRVEGTLILSHDAPKEGKACTTLREALALLKTVPHMKINIDIKTPGLIMDTLALAREAGIADKLLMTGDVGQGDYPVIMANEIPLWLNHYLLPMHEWPNPIQGAEKLGFYFVNIDKRMLTENMLRQADRFSVWTVNDEETLRRLLLAGVKNITTRKPLLALRLRSEAQRPL